MVRRALLIALAMSMAGSAAQAQSARFELSATAGWTFSDGVSGASVTVPGEGTFNRVDPASAFSWGLRGGYLLTENHEVGFLFDLQSTQLEVGGTSTVALGDMNVYNYHGYYSYSFMDIDRPLRPYLLVGLGATQFGAVQVADGEEIGGGTRFSGTFGLGIKVFPFASSTFGFRAEARYTPTYIKSDPGGWWCGYWGCYVLEDAQYANQFELNAGIVLRL